MNDPSTVTDDHLIGAEGFVELTNKIGECERCEIHLEIKKLFFFTCVESILLQFTWLVKIYLKDYVFTTLIYY